ncbi:MAG: ABC transporter ATP-binding protein, partial [Pseudomonadota bacterium]
LIEHDMGFIARLCDPVIVMAEGKVLAQGSAAEVQADEAVIEAYLGGGRRAARRGAPADAAAGGADAPPAGGEATP